MAEKNKGKRYIIIPESITVMMGPKPMTQTNGEPMKLGFKDFVLHMLNEQERFGSTGEKLRMAIRIEKAIESIEPGDVLELEEADWKVLQAVSEEPKHGYPFVPINASQGIPLGRQVVPYVDLLVDPPNRSPKKDPPEEEHAKEGNSAAVTETSAS